MKLPMALVKERKMAGGITKAARYLGVSYPHLYNTLQGRTPSVRFVLKINRMAPELFSTYLCKIDYKSIIRKNKDKYEWCEETQTYKLKEGSHK